MMNNLFKSALQGVVQRMATQENLQTTLQFVQEKFVKEVPRSDARSKIIDAKYEEYANKISGSKFIHFPVYVALDGTYRVIYNEYQKQLFSTTVQDEAFLIAEILDKSTELVYEAYNFNKLDVLIETILSHQKWTDFHLACYIGCVSYISTIFGRDNEKIKAMISTFTVDTNELPIHLSIKNNHLEVTNLLIIMGADVKAKNKQGRNSYHLAAMTSHQILAKLLKERKNKEDGITDKDNEGKIPIILAGESRNFDSVRILADNLDYELYQSLINQGSRPLHSGGSNGLEKKHIAEIILEEHPEFIEIKDLSGNTPLISNVKSGDVEMVLVLIAHGANTNQIDDTGKTPLIYALEGEKISLMKLFIALGADYQSNEFLNEINKLKSGAKNQLKSLLQQLECTQSPKQRSIFELTQKRILEEAKKNHNESGLKLLSLDGGGIRGIATILVLRTIEIKLRQRLQKQDVKLIDHFDWLAGTSTGAIIALGLISGKSTMDVLRLYLRFRDRVFCGKRPYDTTRLEALLQREFGLNTTMGEVAGNTNKKILVTTTKASTIPPELILIRNYDMALEESLLSFKVWKAARCSSAAPTYFEAVDSKYLDGGLMANNPCSDLLVEVTKASEIMRAKGQEPFQINCVLSVGTGRCPPKETKVTNINMPKGFADILQNGISSISSIMSLSKMFIDQICSSDGPVAQRSEALSHANGAPFFRITPNLATEVDLDSADDQTVIELLWAAKCHCEKAANEQINDLIDLLTMK